MPCGHDVHAAIFVCKQYRHFDFCIQIYPDMLNSYQQILCLKYEWCHLKFGRICQLNQWVILTLWSASCRAFEVVVAATTTILCCSKKKITIFSQILLTFSGICDRILIEFIKPRRTSMNYEKIIVELLGRIQVLELIKGKERTVRSFTPLSSIPFAEFIAIAVQPNPPKRV